MTLEAYATALFDHWGVGKAETNDGVMILSSATTAPCGWNWAPPTGATGTAWPRTWWNAISSTISPPATTCAASPGAPSRPSSASSCRSARGPRLRRAAVCATGSSGSACSGPSCWPCRNRWIGDLLARLRRCPQCGRRGLRQTRSVLTAATGALPGTGERIRTCAYCDFEERESFHIPSAGPPQVALRRRRSGGGGASGRW
jgi:uncharacterized protein